MQIVEVDLFNAQTLEAGLAGGFCIRTGAIEAAVFGITGAQDAEFGSQKDLVPETANSFADQLFIDERAVDVGGVDKIDPSSKAR